MSSRLAVLASGSGSNLEAVCQYLDSRGAERGGTVALVLSDRRAAGALAKAEARGIPAFAIEQPSQPDPLLARFDDHSIDLVVLAGYLRLVPTGVTQRFRGRMLNVHPALLPAFGGPGMYGERVHTAVLGAGARVSGVTVQFVDEVYDHGPIIAQWPVPVYHSDTPATLAARVLEVEHLLYPRVIDGVASGRIRLDTDGVVRGGAGASGPTGLFAMAPIEPAALASQIQALIAQ